MTRPPLEVADLIRAAGTAAFFERNRRWLRLSSSGGFNHWTISNNGTATSVLLNNRHFRPDHVPGEDQHEPAVQHDLHSGQCMLSPPVYIPTPILEQFE